MNEEDAREAATIAGKKGRGGDVVKCDNRWCTVHCIALVDAKEEEGRIFPNDSLSQLVTCCAWSTIRALVI